MPHHPGCLAALFPLLRILVWAPLAKRLLPARTITVLSGIKLTLDREYSTWEGKITLPAWAGYQSRTGSYNGSDSSSPSDGTMNITINMEGAGSFSSPVPGKPLLNALQYFLDNQQAIHNDIALHLVKLAHDMRKHDKNIPVIKDPQDLKKYLGPSILHIYACENGQEPCIGLELGSEWEEEHGLGVVTQKGKITGIGHADIAFCGPDPDSLKDLGQ